MKCEHNKTIKVIVQLNDEYIEDGYKILIKGCTKCKPEYEERKNIPVKMFICNMTEMCSKGSCEHMEEHPCINPLKCNGLPNCNQNKDARCIEIKER